MKETPNVSMGERAMAEPLSVHLLTVDDYHAMVEAGILREDDRVELIDGQIIDKMPLGPEHIRIVNVLNKLAVVRASDVVEVSIQNSVRLGLYDEPEPDVVLLKPNRDMTRVPHAEDVLLLVEVADSSVEFDKRIKLPRYAAVGIPEVWIVNIPEKRLECYRNPSLSGYKISRYLSETDEADAQMVPALGLIELRAILGG
jgi:Uma2 family endonuclease